MRLLEQHTWPGNVRELRNVIERATILAPGQFIEAEHLPPVVDGEAPASREAPMALARGDHASRRPSAGLIMMTLAHTRDNKTRAAEILGHQPEDAAQQVEQTAAAAEGEGVGTGAGC